MTQDIRFKLAADGARQTQSEIAGVGRAFASLDGRVGATATSLKNAAATFGRFASLAGGAAAAGFALLARRVADGLDSLNDLAESVGGSVENLSALEDVALRTGSSLDTVATAIVRMNKSLSDAASNKEIATRLFVSQRTIENHLQRVYDKLGVSRRDQLAAELHGAEPDRATTSSG